MAAFRAKDNALGFAPRTCQVTGRRKSVRSLSEQREPCSLGGVRLTGKRGEARGLGCGGLHHQVENS